jgi:hypothetical protein
MGYKSQAYLEGSILYIDGTLWDAEVGDVDEALDILSRIKVPGAPKTVRVFTRPKRRRQKKV